MFVFSEQIIFLYESGTNDEFYDDKIIIVLKIKLYLELYGDLILFNYLILGILLNSFILCSTPISSLVAKYIFYTSSIVSDIFIY